MKTLLALLVVCACWTSPLQAQTPPIMPILGVGNGAFDVPTASVAEAQAQGYRAYVDARPAITLTVTCAGTASPFTCKFLLSALALTGTHTLAVTAFVTAADGELESPKAVLPFTLRKLGAPVVPLVASFKVQPQ